MKSVIVVVAIGAIAMGQAQTVGSKQINAALTSNGDGAERCREIHWPNGFHPEQADLFAHNEMSFMHLARRSSPALSTLKGGRSGIRIPTM